VTAPPTPPPLSSWSEPTRALHEAIDARIRATGRPDLHPDGPTVLPDLIGARGMVAWQEGKGTMAFLNETCWSELPVVYARYGTDAGVGLIRRLRALYDARAAVVTDCGMQAVSLVIDVLMGPKEGDATRGHAVLSRQIYGKSRTYLEWLAQRLGYEITVVDEVDAPTLEQVVRPDTRLVLVETYSNPLTRALDPDAVGAKVVELRASRAPRLRLVVDDTIATPWGPKRSLLSREGVDVVVAAGTKAVGGQDRDILGYVVSQDISLMNEVMDLQAMRGGTLSWRAAEVVARDLEHAGELHRRRCAGATQVAAFLASHADVEAVYHPSLPDHPDREIVERVYARPGSLLAFRIRGLDEDGTLHFCNVLAMTCIVRYALSFDGLVTKVNHHQTVSEFFTPAPRLRRQGIDRLVRLAVGIEAGDDLVAALAWALDAHRRLSPDDVADWQRRRAADLGIPLP
jgi:methionine-gamma-lyase